MNFSQNMDLNVCQDPNDRAANYLAMAAFFL